MAVQSTEVLEKPGLVQILHDTRFVFWRDAAAAA